MQVTARKFMLVYVIFFGASQLCRAQKTKPKDYACTAYPDSIKAAYIAGNYTLMDKLFLAYQRSECYQNNSFSALKKEVISGIIGQRLKDGKIAEAAVLQKSADSIRYLHYSKWRMGITTSTGFSKLGSARWSSGIMVGWHQNDEDNGGFGFDMGITYQRTPFTLNVANNKNDDGTYRPDGYFIKTQGYSTFYNFPFIVSYDLYGSSTPGELGVGLFLGAEVWRQNTTYIKSYYYEHNYTDVYNTTDGLHHVTYSASHDAGYYDEAFFNSKYYLNGISGINFYIKTSNSILLTISPQYAYSNLSLRSVGYDIPYSSFMLRVTLSYLFKTTSK